MPFKKGEVTNPTGRPKGATNKISAEQREFLREFVLENKNKFKTEMKELHGKEFLHIYLSLMQHIMPKPAAAKLKEVPALEEYVAMAVEERRNTATEIQEELWEEEGLEMRKEAIEKRRKARYGV